MKCTTEQLNNSAIPAFKLKYRQIEKINRSISIAFAIAMFLFITAIINTTLYFLKITTNPDYFLAAGALGFTLGLISFLVFFLPYDIIIFTDQNVLVYNVNKNKKIIYNFSEVQNCNYTIYKQNYFMRFLFLDKKDYKVGMNYYQDPEKLMEWYTNNWENKNELHLRR